ncbi:hypothetical protein B0H10DRAFT_1968085 [Mycena sp. CBHHK59/15]|nr:hypothetical protein B0H10DRAFT_1968085 [Mycena sp. CBHHK59/15]
MGLSAEQYHSLKTASSRFLTEKSFSFDDLGRDGRRFGVGLKPKPGRCIGKLWKWLKRSCHKEKRALWCETYHILQFRRANLPTLEIETYIDLDAPKLKARFVSDQEKPQPEVPVAAKKPSQQPSSKWTATDTDWDAAAW